ncbi:MAG: DUF4863 family protein [Planctomycetota bacterium]
MSLETFTELLRPLARDIAALDASDPTAARASLEKSWPLSRAETAAIRAAAEQGLEEGWLTPRENGGIRFGRVAKDLEGATVDAVLMSTPGPRHRHPNGEFDLCFTRSGAARFDGHPEGWVVYPPDSVHVPTVSDGEMLILYFLPGGAIEFL